MQGLLDSLYAAIIRENRWKLYLDGLGNTLTIAVIACAIGIVLGVLVAVVKIYAKQMEPNSHRLQLNKHPVKTIFYLFLPILSKICDLYTTVIRGTPLVIQLLILFSLSAIPDGMTACLIGFGVNSGAYVSEIFRGGIQSVDAGQMEAGRSLGLSRNQTMRRIILPQAVKNILPTLFNEFIILVKETSVAGYIAVNDLTRAADNIKSRTFDVTSLFIAALVYLTLTIILTQIQKVLERRLARSDRN